MCSRRFEVEDFANRFVQVKSMKMCQVSYGCPRITRINANELEQQDRCFQAPFSLSMIRVQFALISVIRGQYLLASTLLLTGRFEVEDFARQIASGDRRKSSIVDMEILD